MFIDVPKHLRQAVLLRGVTGCIANLLYTYSIQLIDLSKASMLFWTNPMVTAIMAYFFLKEKISVYDWVSIVTTIIGIIIIQNPFNAGIIVQD